MRVPIYQLSKMMSVRAHEWVGTGILPVLYGQAILPSAGLSHLSVANLGMSWPDINRTKLLATAVGNLAVTGGMPPKGSQAAPFVVEEACLRYYWAERTLV
jgi:hypothetical protein